MVRTPLNVLIANLYYLGCRTHSQDGYKNLQKWTHLRHGNIISLHTAFTIKAFGDQSIMFVYDFHPGAETLMQRHFVQNNYWKTKRQNGNNNRHCNIVTL